VDQGARDRDPLALADRELGGLLRGVGAEVEAAADAVELAWVMAATQVLLQRDVLALREEGLQRAGLRQVAHVAGAQGGERVVAAALP
jgi:hypothetical protein